MNMKRKLLQSIVLLLLCAILAFTKAEEENTSEGHVTRPVVKVPLEVLRHLADPTETTPNHGGGSTVGSEDRAKLPSMECDEDFDCRQYTNSLDLVCAEGQCTCRPPQCWVYQYIVTGAFSARNEFSCGQCGVLGSSCNATIECDHPGTCWSDDYCHCPQGENYGGICLTSDISWTNTLAFAAMGIVFFLATCIMAINCYKQPPWRNSDAWRCQCCRGAGKNRQRRRGSCEKTPAFTIQAHYASQDFSLPQEDVQGVPPHGLGGAVPRRQRASSTNSGTAASSFSSAHTSMTTVNGSVSGSPTASTSVPHRPLPPPPPLHSPPSVPPSPPPSPSSSLPSSSNPAQPSPASTFPSTSFPPSPPPAHPPSYPPVSRGSSSSGDKNEARENDSSSIQVMEVFNSGPSTSKSSSETASASSAGTSGSCTHERCQLCLPKPPTSSVVAPPRRKSNGVNSNGQSPLLSLKDTSHAENPIELSQL